MWTGCFTNRESAGRQQIEVLPLPQRLKDEVPTVGDFVQNRWCALARDLVADIQEKASCNYLTFRNGWRDIKPQ